MMDGSLGTDGKTPTSYEYNVDVTRNVVALAHACGVSVEGEIGCLGSLETGMAGEEDGVGAEGVLDHSQLLTSVEEATQFVADTNVDALAIAVGTSHGAISLLVHLQAISWQLTVLKNSCGITKYHLLCMVQALYHKNG